MAKNFEKIKVKPTGGEIEVYELKARRAMFWSWVIVVLGIATTIAIVMYEMGKI